MATRVTHARKWYEFSDGTRSRSAKPDWTSLIFETVSPVKDEKGQLVPVTEFAFTRESFSDDIFACAAGHGLMQKMGDDLAGIAEKAKKDGAAFDAKIGYSDYVGERLQDMFNDLQNGIWVEESEGGGGGVTILLEAVLRTFGAAGVEVTDEQRTSLRDKLKETDYRDKMRKRADVAKHHADIMAERAEERRKKAAKAAKAADETPIADLLNA